MIYSNFLGPQFSYLIPFNNSKFKIYGGPNISYLFLTHHTIKSYNYGNGVFEETNFPVENANNLTIGGCLNLRYRCFYSTLLFDYIINSEDMIPIYSYIRDYSFGLHIKIGFILDFHKFISKFDNESKLE